MEENKFRPNRMPQIYGYIVCIVAIITFLISVTTMVNAIIDLGDPLHAGYGTSNLASYNIYKMDILKSQTVDKDNSKTAFITDDQTIHAMYDAAKADKIQKEKHDAFRVIIVDCLLIVICTILFWTHMSWMRKLAKAEKSL